jgi:hypothetical protein
VTSRPSPGTPSDAIIAVYHAGAPESCRAVSRVLGVLEHQGLPPPGADPIVDVNDAHRLWIRACTDPVGSRSELVRYLRRVSGSPLDEAALRRVG